MKSDGNMYPDVLRHIGMVRHQAWSLFRSHNLSPFVCIHDLIAEGALALVQCSRRYDPGYGVQFVTFAFPRVRGRMLDYVRRQCRHDLSQLPPDDHLHSQTRVEQEVEDRETLAYVVGRIKDLPVRRRIVIESVAQGDSLAVAADEVELPLRKTRRLLRSTREAIRNELDLAQAA